MAATVYRTAEITPARLVALYERLGRPLTGKVAVKISTGEPGPRGGNWLSPDLVKDLVQRLGGTLVECNTGYPGHRHETADHYEVAEQHGWTAIAPVDILDGEATMDLPTPPGGHLTRDIVGSHLADYDSLLVLSHFKGHIQGGFGGAVKNASIGLASSAGKLYIHSAGEATDAWQGPTSTHRGFLESMAEAATAVAQRFGDAIAYINVLNNISVDCDCDGNAAPPEMADIGILASLDPVALDRASADLVFAAPDGSKVADRIHEKEGLHTLERAEELGLGTQAYDLVDLD